MVPLPNCFSICVQRGLEGFGLFGVDAFDRVRPWGFSGG